MALTALCVLMALASFARAAESEVSKEYRIKAAFLYNFTKFVEWPPERFGAPQAPIVIGVLGDNPFGAVLEETVKNRKVNARAVEVIQLASPEDAARAHVVFVSADAGSRYETFVRTNSWGILSVSETRNDAHFGQVINFSTAGDKVRFEVDINAAEKRGLRVSAQLQKLASSVRR